MNDTCSDTCENGGSCCSMDFGFTCTCADGFIGNRCQHPDPCFNVVCANNFTCHVTATFTDFYCNCTSEADFYAGKLCEIGGEKWFLSNVLAVTCYCVLYLKSTLKSLMCHRISNGIKDLKGNLLLLLLLLLLISIY